MVDTTHPAILPTQKPTKTIAVVNVFFVKPPIYAQGITLSRLCNATGRDVLTLFEIMARESENPTA